MADEDTGMEQARTLTRSDLYDVISEQLNLPRNQAMDVTTSFFDHISDALVHGENVKLTGFGTLEIKEKQERTGRNPKTGEECPISERKVVKFRASEHTKDEINAGRAKRLKSA